MVEPEHIVYTCVLVSYSRGYDQFDLWFLDQALHVFPRME